MAETHAQANTPFLHWRNILTTNQKQHVALEGSLAERALRRIIRSREEQKFNQKNSSAGCQRRINISKNCSKPSNHQAIGVLKWVHTISA